MHGFGSTDGSELVAAIVRRWNMTAMQIGHAERFSRREILRKRETSGQMKAQLKRIIDGETVTQRNVVLSVGAELVCPELSPARIVLEQLREDDGLLVLRMARRPGKPKAVPAHFLLLAIAEDGEGVWVETDPVMTLPGRKNAMFRDTPSLAVEEKS